MTGRVGLGFPRSERDPGQADPESSRYERYWVLSLIFCVVDRGYEALTHGGAGSDWP